MSEAVDQFIRAADESRELQAQVQGCESADGLLALAESKGYTFTAEELQQTVDGKKGELSEKELESVTGGVDWWGM